MTCRKASIWGPISRSPHQRTQLYASGYHEGRLVASGFTQTIGGLDCPTSTVDAEVRNAPSAYFGLSTPGTLIIDTSAGSSYSYQGIMTDKDGGSESRAQLNLVMGGAGMQELAGVNITYTGTTNVTGGTLMLTDATAFASNVTLSGGMLALNSTMGTLEIFAPTISGSGSVAAVGTGGVSLTAASNYTGSTTVSNGTLDIAGAGSVSCGPTNVPSGSLQVDGLLTTSVLNVTGSGGTQGSGAIGRGGHDPSDRRQPGLQQQHAEHLRGRVGQFNVRRRPGGQRRHADLSGLTALAVRRSKMAVR